MTLETVKKHYNKGNESYNENFSQRLPVIDISISVKRMIYPDFMIVNKTNIEIEYHGLKIGTLSNNFLMST